LHGSCSVWHAPSKDRAGRFDLRAMPSKVNPGSSVVMDHFVCAAPSCHARRPPLVAAPILCAQSRRRRAYVQGATAELKEGPF